MKASQTKTASQNATPYTKQYVLYSCGAAAVLVLALCTWLASSRQATGWEYAWFAAVNGWPDGMYRAMTVITFLGSTWMGVLAVIGAYFVRFYRLAWRLAISIVSAYLVTVFIKHVLARPRPEGLFQDIHLRNFEAGMGFPSGHTTLITVVVLSLIPYISRKHLWIIPLPIIAVGLSRLYLGVHIPLDVIGGMALGTSIVIGWRVLPYSVRSMLRID